MKPKNLLPSAWSHALAALAAVAIAAMLSSCAHFNPPEPAPEPEPAVAEKKPPPEPIKPPPPSSLYEWWGASEYLSHIEVSINEQKARFYSGDKLVGWTTVASGIRKFPTPTGSFAVTEKVQNKKSNLYGKIYNKNGKLVRKGAKMGVHRIPAGGSFKGAPMPFFMRLTNDGIGMHAGPIPRPGNRASHGCIRMPKNFAPILYRHVDVGTPVTIKGNGPTYASYLAKQRKSTPRPATRAVAKAKPAPTPAAEEVPATATTEPVSAPAPPVDVQDSAAATAAAAPPQPDANIAAPAPAAPMSVPPTPSIADAPADTRSYGVPAPGPGPAVAPTPTAPAMTGMGTVNPTVYATPLTEPPALPTSPPRNMPSAPAASPEPPTVTPTTTPAAAAPAPEAPQTPPPAPPAGMTSITDPNPPPPSAAPPASAAVRPTETSDS